MELWGQLSQEKDRFHERMKSYEALPVEERLEIIYCSVTRLFRKTQPFISGIRNIFNIVQHKKTIFAFTPDFSRLDA